MSTSALLVLDCSVAAKWILPEPGRVQALEILEQQESGKISLIAPDLMLAEFASLLSKRHRRKQISAEQAAEAFQLMEQCSPTIVETHSRLARALHLSLQLNMSLWDCVYVSLAIEYGCPLLTADRRLFRAGASHQLSIQLLS